MSGDNIANLAFLGLLGAALAGSYLASNRGNLGKTAQQAMIWGLIFVGVIAVYGMWNDIQRTVTPRQAVASNGQIVIPRSDNGHYHLTLGINGEDIRFIVDTGASQVVLSQDDAVRVGIKLDELRYLGTARTANGTVQTANVWLDEVTLGAIVDTQVRAVVNGGEMDSSLLGMSYLNAFDRIEIRSGELVLTR